MARTRVAGVLIIGLLMTGAMTVASRALAAGYRAGDFLNLNLSQAVLSPKPLGPPAHFEPYGIEAKTDGQPSAKTETKTETSTTDKEAADNQSVEDQTAHQKTAHKSAARRTAGSRARVAQVHPPRKLAVRKHSNPLDAQALDTRGLRQHGRIQVWPCRSGGICNWSD